MAVGRGPGGIGAPFGIGQQGFGIGLHVTPEPARIIRDLPPFYHRGRSVVAAAVVAVAWIPPDPQPTLPPPSVAAITAPTPVTADTPPGVGVPKIVHIEDDQPQQRPPQVAAILAQPANPPVSVAVQASIVSQAWIPPDPPPTLPGKLNGAQLTYDTQPPRRLFQAYIPPLDDVLPQQARPSIAPFQVAVQPAPSRVWQNTVLASWQPVDPVPTLGIKSAANLPKSDLPPFVYAGRTVPQAAIATQAWIPPDPLPTLSIKSAANLPKSDLPPFVDAGRQVTEAAIVSQAWVPPDPLPILSIRSAANLPKADQPPPRSLRPYIPAADEVTPQQPRPSSAPFQVTQVDNPPFVDVGRQAVNARPDYGWQPPDPLPTLGYKSAANLPQAEQPPPSLEALEPVAIEDDYPQQRRPLLAAISVTADNPPFVYAGRKPAVNVQIAYAWQPPDPLPTLNNKLNGAQLTYDTQPPFVHRGRLGVNAADVPFSWLPPDPLPTLSGKLAAILARVDNPPFSHRGRISINAVDVPYSWLPPDPLPTLGGKLNPTVTASAVDNPPFVYAGRLPAINVQIAYGWLPPDPLPTLGGKLSPALIPPVTVDTPPGVGVPKIVPLEDDPLPTLGGKLNPTFLARAADNPPFGKRPVPQVFAYGDPVLYVVGGALTVQATDNPPVVYPGRTPLVQVEIAYSWIPPDPNPTLPRNVAPPLIPTPDNPPFVSAGRRPFQVQIVYGWQPPDPLPTLPGKIAAATFRPDNPNFVNPGRWPGYNVIITAWEPGPPQPQQLPPVVTTSGPTPPTGGQEKFTVSGPTVINLFNTPDAVSHDWDGGVSKRTV